jgi:hypothetical protein
MNTQSRSRKVLSILAAATVSGLVIVATAAPLEAQASRTRPGGGSSSGSSSGGGGGGGGTTTVSGRGSSSAGGGGATVPRSSGAARTRPSAGSGSGPTVIDNDRRPVGFHHPRFSHHHTFYWGYYPYWGSPYWYWGPYWSGWWFDFGYYWPHPYPYYAGVNVYPSQVTPAMGALDLNVTPSKAGVYLNGQYVGVVDQFDGWPRYLWLEEGTYRLTLYREGLQTIAKDYSVYPGVVIDVRERMQPGESVAPEPPPRSTARRDARVAEERERQAAIERGDDWRARVRAEREEMGEAPPVEEVEAGEARDARGEPGRVHLTVEPDDAAVYLDGRFLGTGRELSRLGAGLIVDPGSHKLSVVRPGRESRSVDFEIEAGQEIDLEVALAAAG